MKIRVLGPAICVGVVALASVFLAGSIGQELRAVADARRIETAATVRASLIATSAELSAERTLTEVALALREPISSNLKMLLDFQRVRFDQQVAELGRLTSDAVGQVPGAERLGIALSEHQRRLAALRRQVNADAATTMGRRDTERSRLSVSDLRDMTRSLFDLAAYLGTSQAMIPSDLVTGNVLQKLGWELREDLSQDETYFLIASLLRAPVDAVALQEMDSRFARARQTWTSLQPYLARPGLPADVVQAGRQIERVIFSEYGGERAGWVALAAVGSFPLTFEAFWHTATTTLQPAATLTSAGAEMASRAAADVAQAAWISLLRLLVGAVLAVALLVIFVWFIAFRLSRRIEGLTALMVRLASGDLAVEPGRFKGRDEIGQMASAVEVFRANALRVRSLETASQAASERAKAQRRSELDLFASGFETAVGEIVRSVSHASGDLISAATMLTGTADETSRQSDKAASGAEQASQLVGTVAAEAGAVARSMRDANGRLRASVDTSGRAAQDAEAAARQIEELSAAVGRIEHVARTIGEIADQTNLLALNATIEAARAGEAGKGFAVVAQEVKALASQTARATGEIAGQIATLQSSTASSVARIAEVTGAIREVAGTTSAIASLVEDQGVSVSRIAEEFLQAASGAEQVAGSVATMAGSAQTARSASTQVLTLATNLSNQAERLQGEVARAVGSIRAA